MLIYQNNPFQGNIYLYDGLTTIQITNDTLYKWHCKLNNIGKAVVWYGGNSPPINNLEIMLYNGMTTIQLTQNEYLDQFPNIANGNVVWTGFPPTGGDNGEIYLYDGSSLVQITDNNYIDQAPQINNNGLIVWEGGDSDIEIYLFNGRRITQLTDNDYNDINPKINANGHIVWYGKGDVFVYDGMVTTRLTNGGYQVGGNQMINDKGNIVWCAREISSSSTADYEIFIACRAIDANFSGSPTGGAAPLTVSFTDSSTGEIEAGRGLLVMAARVRNRTPRTHIMFPAPIR